MENSFGNAVLLIKDAIIRSRYHAATLVNRELLSLYYAVGRYVSRNSRNSVWGQGAIKQISNDLQKELPGLRGFGEVSLKKMRLFYEAWQPVFTNRQLTTDELKAIQNFGADIDLKRGKFKPSYLGQLNFYLSALDDYVRQPDEFPSIGIILCKEANRSIVEYAVRDYTKPMGVATYRTRNEMPEQWQKALPDFDEMKKLLDNTGNE